MDTAELIKKALKEDIGSGDITTETIMLKDKQAEAYITAKEDGIICGLDIAKEVFQTLDKNIIFEHLSKDTDKVAAGKDIAKITGSEKAILTGERTALNFLGHLSGIATETSRFVALCRNAQILDTRKTTPLLRNFEKYAVRCGGGKNHRMGLYDMILIKDNHIKAAGSVRNALESAKKANEKNTAAKMKIEIECETLDEVKEALECGVADIIMLDNMTTEDMKKAVNIIGKKARIEASGGVNLKTVSEIDKTGVDYISVGSITSSAKRLDLSLSIRK